MKTAKSVAKRIGIRLTYLLPVLLIALFINYFLLRQMPGDPVQIYLGEEAFRIAVQNGEYDMWVKRLGVDQPIFVQFAKWLGRLLSGDLGNTLATGQTVGEYLRTPLMNTLKLNLISFSLSLSLAILIGVKQAVKRGKTFDNVAGVSTLMGISLPSFMTALLFIFLFSVRLGWLPYYGMYDPLDKTTPMWLNELKHMILPLSVILVGSLASISRYMKAAMSDALSKDFVRTARAKGLSERKVIWKHAFRNALVPVITILGAFLPALFAGSIITETIFGWNGVGSKLIDAISQRDVNVLMATTTLYLSLTLVSYILVDIGYAIADPRMRK